MVSANPGRTAMMRWTGLVLFGLVSLFLIAFGFLYASAREMLWFHAAAVPESVRDDVRPLYFALMKLIGGSSAALGVLGAWIVVGPLRKGVRGAGAALVVAYAIPLLTAAYVAETLATLTGSPTSWHIMGVLLAIVAVAYLAHLLAQRAVALRGAPAPLSNEGVRG